MIFIFFKNLNFINPLFFRLFSIINVQMFNSILNNLYLVINYIYKFKSIFKKKFHLLFFKNYVLYFYKSTIKGFKKILKIFGIGYRFSLHLNIICLKLGYNHILIRFIPLSIKLIKKGKQFLYVFGSNLNNVSNCMHAIKNLRLPNVYTGKGFRFKNKKSKFKLKKGKVSSV